MIAYILTVFYFTVLIFVSLVLLHWYNAQNCPLISILIPPLLLETQPLVHKNSGRRIGGSKPDIKFRTMENRYDRKLKIKSYLTNIT